MLLLVVDAPSGSAAGRASPSAQDLGEGTLELAAGAGVDERIEAAIAVAQPEAAREERRRNAARRAQRLCKT